jgi:hypothetical protein
MTSGAVETVETAGGSRIASLATAIIAVLAALGTLFTHHRSIAALAAKNGAILTQSRATDLYTAYESKEIRYNFGIALLESGLIRNAKTQARLAAAAQGERASSTAALEKARSMEDQAARYDERAETMLRSYELLLFATTAFDVAIILVAISALRGARLFLPIGFALTGGGLVLFAIGLLAAR